ncbi:hypothetical protein BgAZ_105280 [Babesia gibsoni]|uniref:Autophagy-related protein n=1 Tax=Babesia gibsoni TaxID=33632 RepID=A0AAD8PG34_BABGI|nr:hypothetical protein BgAZ_105280 [Babesia gibsoni]
MVYAGEGVLTESYVDRQNEIASLRSRFHNRIPIICLAKAQSTVRIERSKFLVPANMMYAEFKYVLQKHLLCQAMNSPDFFGKNMTLHVYVNDMVPKSQTHIGELYRKHRSDDGVLYLMYSNECSLG